MYEDKTLVCKECGNEFVFTAGEQEFYAERGFQNEPQRCKACRDARKNATRGPREYFTATCAACGGEARVPFEPKSDRPVYCSERREASYRECFRFGIAGIMSCFSHAVIHPIVRAYSMSFHSYHKSKLFLL